MSHYQKSYSDESRLQQLNALTGMPLTRLDVRRPVPKAEQGKLAAPPLVSEDIWNAVQERLVVMKARHGGSPKQTRMLSGLAACPCCGGAAILRYQTAHGKPYRYFVCSASRKARWAGDGPVCSGVVYPLPVVEAAALTALQEAYSRPEAIAEALRVYRRQEQPLPDASDAARAEIALLNVALTRLGAEEAATVQAQIAGMMAGASPNAYAAAFADIAARRKDMENRRGVLSVRLSSRLTVSSAGTELPNMERVLADAWRVLTNESVPGATKRQILGTVVQKVICGKEGAKVVFVPGLFGENTGHEDASRRTCYTTCMGISTHR